MRSRPPQAEDGAAEFWAALAGDDNASTEALLAPPALAEVGAGDGMARRVRDRLGAGRFGRVGSVG
jgi:hypothetical protein